MGIGGLPTIGRSPDFAMTYFEILNRIIDEGIAGARQDYNKPDQSSKLQGSIEGFDACRGRKVSELTMLLLSSEENSRRAYFANLKEISSIDEYWRLQCFAAEIEWVCNVMSAVLETNGYPTIINPTVRGVMQATRIIGVKGKLEDYDPL